MEGLDGSVDFFDILEQTDWNRSMQRTIIHWIGLQPEQEVLDAGCGPGRFATHLAQRTQWVIGVDAAERMLERARRNASDFHLNNMTFQQANIRSLPFPDDSFDLVTCLDLLFMFEDPRPAMQELVRVCRPGGQIVLLNPSAQMNPWSAQTYCEAHELKDFQKDSFLAWSTAAARRRLYDDDGWQQFAADCDADIIASRLLLDGLAVVYRLAPQKLAAPIEIADLETADFAETSPNATDEVTP